MAPSTKKTKQAAPAAPAPEEEQQAVDPLADASLADLEDEITTGPAANWEVAVSPFTPFGNAHWIVRPGRAATWMERVEFRRLIRSLGGGRRGGGGV